MYGNQTAEPTRVDWRHRSRATREHHLTRDELAELSPSFRRIEHPALDRSMTFHPSESVHAGSWSFEPNLSHIRIHTVERCVVMDGWNLPIFDGSRRISGVRGSEGIWGDHVRIRDPR